MNKLSVEDLEIKGQKVLCRVDYNVPLENGAVSDNKRISASLDTVRHILEKGGRLILMSHLGRPDGKADPKYSLKPVAAELAKLLGRPVSFASDCIGREAESKVASLTDGHILLLENLRFHKEEENNDPDFARSLAKLGDIYVNDAFGTAHRAHASTAGVTKYLKRAACGFLMKKELDYLGSALDHPRRPFTAIMGGAKVKDKINVLKNLAPKVDHLIIGGGMAYTFLKAKGYEIGKSLLDTSSLDFAASLLKTSGDKIHLPVDILQTDHLDFNGRTLGRTEIVPADGIKASWEGVDIGPKTMKAFGQVVAQSKTVIWNGPMGVFEIEASSKGTFFVAEALAQATDNGTTSVIGGGDSASAVKKAGLGKRMSHVSTGGGASLEYMEGRELPGIAALSDR